jgi:hypothetical protein
MPGGAAPHDNPLIADSQRDPLADRCCHGAPPGSPGILRYRRGLGQQESQSHVRAGTIEDDSPAPTVRPIRQGGKRCGSPGKTPAPASPGGKAACPVVRSCRRTSREGHWLRLTVRARSASWPAAADLIATRTRWTGRKRTPVLRHLSAPDGRPIQAGVPRWSQIPRNGRRAPARPWSSGQPRRPASPPGHAGSAGSGGGLGWPGRRLKLVLAPAA